MSDKGRSFKKQQGVANEQDRTDNQHPRLIGQQNGEGLDTSSFSRPGHKDYPSGESRLSPSVGITQHNHQQ